MFGCGENCGEMGPPPDTILSMPPPPLPSFLLPKAALSTIVSNDTHPCIASFMCEPNPRPRESGLELIELSGRNQIEWENTWVFILITSIVGVLILGGLLAVLLLKCRDKLTFSYHESNLKQGSISALGDSSKSNPFLSGGMLYPCANNRDSLQQQMVTDNRLLWATLTPHGTRHFVSDFPSGQEGHYEIIDYKMKTHTTGREYKRTPIKSFDNNGFMDYDYEDPTPLMDSYHDDLDSGYQEPQEVIGTLNRHLTPTPTRVENPTLLPLNGHARNYNTMSYTNGSTYGAMNSRKSTPTRRISDTNYPM